MHIIVRGKHDSLGKTRSQHEKNLRKEWGSTMSDENFDKLKHLEKKAKRQDRVGEKNFIPGHQVENEV